MPGYITITVIIPLVITAFIMGNYTLYERTLVKHSWPWQFLIVTVVFLVQEYVITFMSYQLADYYFYQYVIAILMYNLLNTGGYGAYMACLTPFVVNSCLVLMGSRPVIYQSLWVGWLLFMLVTVLGSRLASRGSTISMTIQMLILNIGGPYVMYWLNEIDVTTLNVPIHHTVELTCGTLMILVVYRYFFEQELLNINLYKQAYHNSLFDELTGLGNYRSLVDYTEQAATWEGDVAIAVIDVDRFKSVNDRYGHVTGNLALQYLANFLAAAMQNEKHVNARVFRYGGEEFCIVFTNVRAERFHEVVDRLKTYQRIFAAQPFFTHQGERLRLTFSAGITFWQAGEKLGPVFERADQALYSAKRHGRNQVRIFNQPQAKGVAE